MRNPLNCIDCKIEQCRKIYNLRQELKQRDLVILKLESQVEKFLNILKSDDELSWYGKSEDDRLNDIFPDEGENDD